MWKLQEPFIKTQHIQLVDCWKTNKGSIKVRLKYIYVPFLTAATKQNEKKQSIKTGLQWNFNVKDLGTGTEIKISIAIQGYALVDREIKDFIESLLHIDYKNVSIARIQSTYLL